MHFYAFKYNEQEKQIELGDTGKVVARYDARVSNMLVPDVDPSIGAKVALHVLNGLNRVHDIRFGTGEKAAKLLQEADFSEPKSQRLVHDKHTLSYNEYSDTVRVKETNQLLLKKEGESWVFDFDGGAPEQLVQKTYLKFYENPELKTASPEVLVDALSGNGMTRKLETNSLGL
ncbi:MAG: hypothetical protein CMF13_02235 [Idiomarina sp.]|nr:hypothetical protein [Idiomarina sp.]|tara:strand:- start:2027 stop:2548 length:522 start_codon:yes stop_codon:yes gene_type:complete